MSKLEEKMAGGVRQVKAQQGEGSANPPGSDDGRQTAGTAETGEGDRKQKSAQAARGGEQPKRQPASGKAQRRGRRTARNEDQVPPPSLDDPWGNLYPERIWPD